MRIVQPHRNHYHRSKVMHPTETKLRCQRFKAVKAQVAQNARPHSPRAPLLAHPYLAWPSRNTASLPSRENVRQMPQQQLKYVPVASIPRRNSAFLTEGGSGGQASKPPRMQIQAPLEASQGGKAKGWTEKTYHVNGSSAFTLYQQQEQQQQMALKHGAAAAVTAPSRTSYTWVLIPMMQKLPQQVQVSPTTVSNYNTSAEMVAANCFAAAETSPIPRLPAQDGPLQS